MDKLNAVLPKVLNKRGLGEHARGALTVFRASVWMAEKLPHLKELVQVHKVQDGVVHVSCGHSIALQECQSVTADLLQFLHLECPFAGVKEVRIIRV